MREELTSRVDGSAVDGSAVDGSAVDGSAVDGSAVDGSAVDGSAVDGSAVDALAGHSPDGDAARAWCCTRRQLLGMVTCAGFSTIVAACRDGPTTASDSANAVTVTRDEIVVRLDQLAALRAPDSMHVLGEQQVAILRVGEADYRAFTNICTHAGCGIYIFAGQRLRCQCHGSEFDVNGTNVAGPAPSPLRRYAVTFDNSARELRIALG